MDVLQSILVAAHLLGASLIVGTFFVQMRASYGFRFDLMLIGASVQLATGVALYGIAMSGGEPNHMKLGIKSLIAIVVFVAALVAFLQQRKATRTQQGLADGGAVAAAAGVTSTIAQPRLKPLFHVAGGLAVINVLIAAIWN